MISKWSLVIYVQTVQQYKIVSTISNVKLIEWLLGNSVLFILICKSRIGFHIRHSLLCLCFVFLRLVYLMFPVSLDCPCWLPEFPKSHSKIIHFLFRNIEMIEWISSHIVFIEAYLLIYI
jgi:hypothetical protein